MAFLTNRLNIEPVFRRITEVMVIVLCNIPTVSAMIGRHFRYSSCRNRVCYGRSCGLLFGAFYSVTCLSRFSFFALKPTLTRNFTRDGFRITIYTGLTLFSNAINFCSVFVKRINRFDLIATRTLFSYNRVRHFCSPKQDCLELLSGPIPVCSLFYYINK
jgi:hypothetical protein